MTFGQLRNIRRKCQNSQAKVWKVSKASPFRADLFSVWVYAKAFNDRDFCLKRNRRLTVNMHLDDSKPRLPQANYTLLYFVSFSYQPLYALEIGTFLFRSTIIREKKKSVVTDVFLIEWFIIVAGYA